MRRLSVLSALIVFCYCVGHSAQPAAAQEQSFARVFDCSNETGRAELYLPGSALARVGKQELAIGDKTAAGYLAFDFTPVGKNKTLEAVSIKLDTTGNALDIKLLERGSIATIPLAGGRVSFPQRLAEEMDCKPFNKN